METLDSHIHPDNFTKTCRNSWRPIESNDRPPSQRSLHVGIVVDDSLYIFGGYDGTQRTNDFYRFDFDTCTWTQIITNNLPPSPRDRHVAVVYDRFIYIFGGFDGVNRVNDFNCYNINTNMWKEVPNKGSTQAPTPRHSHSGCVFQKHMYIFAGYDGLYKNDFYKFSFETSSWSSIKDSNPSAENWPKPRYRTSLTSHKDKIYMFGGHDGTKQLNDFYSFDPKLEVWAQINTATYSPSPRDSHVAASYGSSLYLFGGSTGASGSNSRDDFYEYDLEEKKWYQILCSDHAPPSRFCHVGVVYNKKFMVFGGYDGVNRLNDFYEHACEAEINCPESTLIQDQASLVNNPMFSDIQFILEGHKIIYAHRILLVRVPYFMAMFQSQMKECRENQVKIEDITAKTFLQLLNYIYTDQVETGNMENIVELFEAADLFGIEGLKIYCEKAIFSMIDVDNAPSILSSADKRGAYKLRERSLNFIIKNFDEVSKTPAFENLMRTDVELALEIIKKR